MGGRGIQSSLPLTVVQLTVQRVTQTVAQPAKFPSQLINRIWENPMRNDLTVYIISIAFTLTYCTSS